MRPLRSVPLAVTFAFACALANARARTSPAAVAGPNPAVVAVFPSGDAVPERLLRVSIVFARAPDPAIAGTVTLTSGDALVRAPFADPPLWSADGTVLTELLDPSRQKRGLGAHRRAGYVLARDRRATLRVAGREVASWAVRAGGCAPLDPGRWRIASPRAGTRDALVVTFAAPVDALARDRLAIARADRTRVAGRGSFGPNETTWSFVPDEAWRPGVALAVHPRFEDPCGNEIGEPFEHATAIGRGSTRATTFVPVALRARAIPQETTIGRRPSALPSPS